MSFREKLQTYVARCGTPAKFVAKTVIGYAVPGSGPLIDIVEKLIDCAQKTAKDNIEVDGLASKADLGRIEKMFDELLGDMSGVVEQLKHLEAVPDIAKQTLRVTLATEEHCLAATQRLFEQGMQLSAMKAQLEKLSAGQEGSVDLLHRLFRSHLDYLEEQRQQNVAPGQLDERLKEMRELILAVLPPPPPTRKVGDTTTAALGMKFAWVPPGKSWLGGGGGRPGTTPFTLETGLWCGIYLVTQAEWEKVMASNPSHFKGNPRFPAETVSWNDVQTFLQKLNARGGGYSYRLPTDQEWEYICRGGPITQDQSKYHYYFAKSKTDLTPNPTDDLANKANFANQLQKPSNVGSYLPNPLGIRDLHGNVWEWTSSLWEVGGSRRVVRGGSCDDDAEGCTASCRGRRCLGGSNGGVGFRLLAVPRESE